MYTGDYYKTKKKEVAMDIIEILGYIASIMIAVSITMKSFIRFRIINFIGAFLLVVYSIFIESYPIALLNTFSCIINIYYLRQYYYRHDFYRLVPLDKQSDYLNEFISFYAEDIKKFYPDFYIKDTDNILCYCILRNMVPGGVFIVEKADDSAQVLLDYVTAEFRDKKIGRFLYHKNQEHFSAVGVKKFYFFHPDKKTINYFQSMGFEHVSDGKYIFHIAK
jgi:N-acetylglutamate synthase-like GNAT family acetyltransferase